MMKCEWILCPVCGSKTRNKIRKDTVLENYPLYCPKCRQGCLLEVVREQYTDFYRDKERWRYLQKLDTKNRLLSLDGFTDSEGNPLDFITDEAVDIAETVVNAVMVDRLKAALPLLSDSEQELIQAIFFDGLSEREVGARLGITQSVVNKRKARILRKLRKIIEN